MTVHLPLTTYEHALAVGKLQATAGLYRDVEGLLQGKAVVVSILDDPLHTAP